MQNSISIQIDVLLHGEYADADRIQILQLLHGKPMTQKELAAVLKLNSGTLSRHMAGLAAVGLVVRDRAQGPYRLVAPAETLAVSQAISRLAATLGQVQLEASTAHEQELARMAAARADGAAAPDDG